MTLPSIPDGRLDGGSAIAAWTGLLIADRSPRERALMDAAWRIADLTNGEIATARRDPPDTPVVRDAAWHRVALAAYRLLLAAITADVGLVQACLADPGRIRAWLASASTEPGSESATVGGAWDFGDLTEDVGRKLTNLLEQAQRADVFGIPDHTITAWYLPDVEDPGQDGFLITVDTPTGHRFCSDWLTYTEVVAPDLSGTALVIETLTCLAVTVDQILTTHAGGRSSPASENAEAAFTRPGTRSLDDRATPPPSQLPRPGRHR
jgi:hypothetical protein